MADTPQTLALLVLEQKYRGNIIRQINRRSVLLKALRLVPGGGKNVAWTVEGSGAVAENYTDGADAANFGSDSQQAAVLNWALERANFRVTDLARRAAASSETPQGVQDLVGRNMENASAALASRLNSELFVGPGTGTRVCGLDEAIGDNANTYAGIDRSNADNAFWRPYVIDPGSSTTLTLAQIRKDLGTIYDQCGEQPDVAMCSTDVFNTVVNLFEATRRRVQDIQTARGIVKLDAGYGAVEVDGCMFLKDKDAAANTIYYLNSNYVEIEYLPPDPKLLNELRNLGMEMPMDDGYGAFPLGILCEKLAKTGPSDKYECLANLQLAVRKPRSCGVRLNVATT